MTALVVVYALRFLALGYATLDARLSVVSPRLTSAALSLGAAPRRVLTAVHLPLARSGMHAVHAVVDRRQVVSLLGPLREAGASAILVLPIENLVP